MSIKKFGKLFLVALSTFLIALSVVASWLVSYGFYELSQFLEGWDWGGPSTWWDEAKMMLAMSPGPLSLSFLFLYVYKGKKVYFYLLMTLLVISIGVLIAANWNLLRGR